MKQTGCYSLSRIDEIVKKNENVVEMAVINIPKICDFEAQSEEKAAFYVTVCPQ